MKKGFMGHLRDVVIKDEAVGSGNCSLNALMNAARNRFPRETPPVAVQL